MRGHRRSWMIMTVVLFAVSPQLSYGKPWRTRSPTPIDAETFQRLWTAVQAEPFADGKLEQLRAVAGGNRYTFAGPQAVALLRGFNFWSDRLQALRLLPVVNFDEAGAVVAYFDSAPALLRSEARRILLGSSKEEG